MTFNDEADKFDETISEYTNEDVRVLRPASNTVIIKIDDPEDVDHQQIVEVAGMFGGRVQILDKGKWKVNF